MLTLVEAAMAIGFAAGAFVMFGVMQVVDAYRPRPEPAPFIDRTRARRCAIDPWRQPAGGTS